MDQVPFSGAVAGLGLLAAVGARAEVLMTQEQALALAFGPEAAVERTSVALSDEQARRVEAACSCELSTRLAVSYRATRDGRHAGTAYFDSHVVRTLPEVLMVVVDPDRTVRRVDVLAFREPAEYLPSERWLAQFPGKTLGPQLAVKRDIRGITGATLTARAATNAVRRVLALHDELAATTTPPAGSPP